MNWFHLFHHTSAEEDADRAEAAAERRARERLIVLASFLGWPKVLIWTASRYEVVPGGQTAWQERTKNWTPAKVAQAVRLLESEYLLSTHAHTPAARQPR
jgi:fatty acid desaturase